MKVPRSIFSAMYVVAGLAGAFYPELAVADAKMTNFKPSVHGFKFDNGFVNNFISGIDVRTTGLCGGMSYTALDYFNKRVKHTNQDYRPAEHTKLRKYIYGRQVDSLKPNLDKWAELGFNPGGARNSEFFNWGLQGTRGGRLQELKIYIDRGIPVPLGLQSCGRGCSGNHQVVAIGYDLGRYKGDLKAYKEELKIYTYDPNFPGRKMTLVPDVRNKRYYYKNNPSSKWQAYFVDRKYRVKTPLRYKPKNWPRDGRVHALVVGMRTGDDDLRGGRDNLDITVKILGGFTKTFRNVNHGARWVVGSSQWVELPFGASVDPTKIASVTLSTNFRGGVGGDNWDLQNLAIRAYGNGVRKDLYYQGRGRRTPLVRFTGHKKKFNVTLRKATVPRGHVRALEFRFTTGNDDLRGGNDNVNVTVGFKDGRHERFRNANDARKWHNGTTHTVKYELIRPVHPSYLKNISLNTTFRGGMGGDNWNLNKFEVFAVIDGRARRIFSRSGNPLVRFTGKRRSYVATVK
ncbi:MAG: hypothetical protein OEU46_08525 [Alphaproteobacteria bacterium]|nr:hypothetical protein [Alphaproteobacteria bacterium]